jgi:hypothetical protein
MNLLFKKLLCAMSLMVLPLSMRANEPADFSFQDLSQEEQQQLLQEMLLRKLVAEVLIDLMRSNVKTIDWLLENYLTQPEESTKRIMHIVQLHSKHRWENILSTFAVDLGIMSEEDYRSFMNESAAFLRQVIAPELEKWLYCSVHAGMMRKQ